MVRQGSSRSIYAITLIVAACSLLYELLIAQTLAMLAMNIVVWYSLTVGTYLFAMGIGSFLCRPLFARRDGWAALYQVEVVLTAVGGLAVVLVHLAHILNGYLFQKDAETSGAFVFFGCAFVVTVLVGLLSGLELPLLIRIGNEASPDRKLTNRVLAIDYLGSLLAGMVFPLVLLPRLELMTIGFLVASLNAAVAIWIGVVFVRDARRTWVRLAPAAACATILALAFLNLDAIEQYFLQKYYYYYEASYDLFTMFGSMKDYPRVARDSSPYQKIDVVHDLTPTMAETLSPAYSTKLAENPGFPRSICLYLNGDYQLNSSYEEVYHEYLAHVPVLMNGRVPGKVAVLGGGDGLLVRELVKYPAIREITLVDIDPTLVGMARTDPTFTAMNGRSLDDPRVRIVLGDAYQYVRRSRETFDAIYMDFPDEVDYNLSMLNSREFFHFVRNRLADDGFAVLQSWEIGRFTAPDAQGRRRVREDSTWPYFYETLKKAGFATIVPYLTNLEMDNPKAREILEKSGILDEDLAAEGSGGAESAERRNELARDRMVEFVRRQRDAFIYVGKNPKAEIAPYRDNGVKLYVLNERRYRMALDIPFPTSPGVDDSKVNSITRPTLPRISFWDTRLPNY